MKLFGSLTELVATVFRANSQAVTLRPNQTTTYSASRDVQLPQQDSDAVIVSRNSTDTLTNKTLTGNIAVNLVSGAATATLPTTTGTLATLANAETFTNKTISGASNTLTVRAASDITGQLPTANGGTGQNSTATFPTSGVVVTEAGTETLTNKSLTAPVMTSFQDLTEIATPATPGAGVVRLYSKSGDGIYTKTSAGVESQLSTTSTATPTAQGLVTSYFPVIQSGISAVTNASATSTTTDGFRAYLFSTGASNRTLTLPAASANAGRVLNVKKTDSGAGTVAITRAGSDTIDGATTYTLTSQFDSITLICDGSATWTVASLPLATTALAGAISTGTQSIAGAKTFSGNIVANALVDISGGTGAKFATTGGTAATLSYYEEFSRAIITGDLSPVSGGGTFSTTGGTLRVTRIGKVVTLTLDGFSTTTASSVQGINVGSTTTQFPSRFYPANEIRTGIGISGLGGTGVFWSISITSAGVVRLLTENNAHTVVSIADQPYLIGCTITYTL